MKRLVAIIFIVVLIATGAVWEQIFINRTYNELEAKLNALVDSVENSPEDAVDTEQNKALANDLYEVWLEKERVLCYLVKHTETFQVSDSIIYAKNFINFNNKEEAMVALTKLQYLFQVRHYNIGTSPQNLI
jgi:molybdopterin-guanine dinucleotide biosynthesis protein A